MPFTDVAGYRRFGRPCCLHLQVVKLCGVVVGCRHFGQPCCLHLQVVTLCNIVVGYQRFGGPCCLHLQDKDLNYYLFFCTFPFTVFDVVNDQMKRKWRWSFLGSVFPPLRNGEAQP
jgi:hypothetical protein